MIQIKRILCPIDFSECSYRALHHGLALARRYTASVTVLHVFTNVANIEVPGVPLVDPDRMLLVDRMRAFVGATPPDVPVDLVARCAPNVIREILAEARRADLIVIGSHGLSGFDRFLLGSVTEKVVRKSPSPIVVVPPHTSETDGLGLADGVPPRILCAIDFSEASLWALEYAISLAEETDAGLTLFHSIEVPPELHGPIPATADFNIEQCHAEAHAACLQRLRELVPPSARHDHQLKTVVTEGAAYRELLRLSTEQPADLIVMGVRGRGAVDLLLFGSNTARVIREATCPVLIVPRPHGSPDTRAIE